MRWDCSEVWHRAKAVGWTDVELARRMGVHQTTIFRVRHGHTQPSMRFYDGLRLAFPDIDPSVLMRRVEKVPS